MLSALFVILSMIAIYTGIAYTLYLDMIVPLFVCLIYIKLDFRHTLLSSITSLLIVTFTIGNVASAIWMSQGILMGLICGYFIRKRGSVFDDLVCSSILGTFIMVLIDVYFSKLTGYSFMKEFDSYRDLFPLQGEYIGIAFNIFVAMVAMSTVLMVYIGALFIGKSINILNENCIQKYVEIKNFKKCGSSSYCSKKTYYFGIIYLILIELLNSIGFEFKFIYFKTVIMAIRVILIYFILRDSFTFVTREIYNKLQLSKVANLIWLVLLYMLLINFRFTFIILVITSQIIKYSDKLRNLQINTLKRN